MIHNIMVKPTTTSLHTILTLSWTCSTEPSTSEGGGMYSQIKLAKPQARFSILILNKTYLTGGTIPLILGLFCQTQLKVSPCFQVLTSSSSKLTVLCEHYLKLHCITSNYSSINTNPHHCSTFVLNATQWSSNLINFKKYMIWKKIITLQAGSNHTICDYHVDGPYIKNNRQLI
jgi:hypothetical protein